MLTGRFGPSLLWLRGVKPNLKEAARKFRINIGLLDFGSGSIIEALTDECESQPFLLSGKRWLHLPDYLQHRLARVSVGLGEKPSRPERRKVGKSQPHLCRNSISVIKTRAKRAETRYKAKDDNDDQTTTFSSRGSWTGFKASHCSSLASEWKPDSSRWSRISGQRLTYRLLPSGTCSSLLLCRTFLSSSGFLPRPSVGR